MVTQPAISAGSAIAMAKNEFQKPSAEMSSRRKPSGLPIIMRQVPVKYCWISSILGML